MQDDFAAMISNAHLWIIWALDIEKGIFSGPLKKKKKNFSVPPVSFPIPKSIKSSYIIHKHLILILFLIPLNSKTTNRIEYKRSGTKKIN